MRADRANRAVNIFAMLVALSVVVALIAFVWRITILLAEPDPIVLRQGTSASQDITPALVLAPFGKADISTAPQTTLPLQLRGIMLMQPRVRSTALIAANGGVPVAYAAGQSVPGGATIEAIGIDHVILRVAGRLERLDLPRVSTPTASPSSPPAAGSPQSAIPVPPPPGSQSMAMPGPIASIFAAIPASPAPGGYRVGAPLSPNAGQAGLQPGDLIERINGVPVEGLSADRTQLASLMASGYAQIGVLRGTRRLSLSFPFR